MKFLFSTVKGGNFGDNLNCLLWNTLLSKIGAIRPHQAIYGVGSFEKLVVPAGIQKVHVMGSGFAGSEGLFSTDPKSVRFHFVRGPKSASAWNYDRGALGDGALLLAQTYLYDLPCAIPGLLVGYVPHHVSDQLADYESICMQAGVRYIRSKGYDTERFIREVKACDYIITEALHGAIVADIFRKPWAAVSSKRHINSFKWEDWCQSVGLAYRPYPIEFACTRGVRADIRMLNGVKRILGLLGLGKAKWRHKHVFYEGKEAEAVIAGQIRTVLRDGEFVLSAPQILSRMMDVSAQALAELKAEVAA